MDVKGLEKTYGIRIPVPEYSEYYINTLLRSKEKESLKREIESFTNFSKELGEESEKTFKHKLIEKSVLYLKNIIYERVNAWSAPEQFVLQTNDFKPEDGKCYISFDVKQANWTVTKHFLSLDFPVWEEYSKTVLEFPEALAYSKPLRQAILGQVVNPKRYDSMQKYLTWKHLDELKNLPEDIGKVVSVYAEEIILEIKKEDSSVIEYLNSLKWIVPVKYTIFKTKIHNNYGDTIIVKEVLNEDFSLKWKSLYGVNGHRFYIHFKSLILEEPLDDKDMLFKLEGKIFKWCGNDLKDYREWGYVKKWIKPLKWDSENRRAYIDNEKDVLYFIISITKNEIIVYDLKEKQDIFLPCEKFHFKDVVSEYHYEKIQKYIEQ